MNPEQKIANYAKALSKGLSSLSSDERQEIVAEIVAHLEHGNANGRLDETIADLGTPQSCASAYREELSLQVAMERGGPVSTFGALLSLSAKRILAAFGLLFAGMFMLISIALAISVVVEFINPQAVGLWVADDGSTFVFGVVDEASNKRDVLGSWYVPITSTLTVVTFVLSQWIAGFFLRLMAVHMRPMSLNN